MKSYSTIIFDLFDTVVDFHFPMLPLVEMNGTSVHTTSREVFGVFSTMYGGHDYHHFHKLFIESYHEFEARKKLDNREFPSSKRFELLLDKLGIEPCPENTGLVDDMVSKHMFYLKNAVTMPPENRAALEHLRITHTLGLLTNFDYAPTANSIIHEFNIINFFDSILISVDTGWRKPSSKVFELILEDLGADPGETLFVGDNFEADVAGAKRAGMDAVWIRSKNVPVSSDISLADHIIDSMPGVLDIV